MKSKALSILFLFLVNVLLAQIPEYYNSIDFNQTGASVKDDLTALISVQTAFPYSSSSTDTWDILQESDVITTTNVLLLYGYDDNDNNPVTDRLRDKSLICNFNGNCNGYWNREHVYPKSLAAPALETDSAGSGTDLHNLRAADTQMNSTRNNNVYEEGSGNAGLTTNGFYPGDEYKGDVARIIMYMYTRYPSQCLANEVGYGPKSYNANIPDIFLEWNKDDPVSAYEINRNEIIYGYQGNRNPFIDNPYLATIIWGGPAGVTDTWGNTQGPSVGFITNTSAVTETNTSFNTLIPINFTNYEAPVTIYVTIDDASTAEAEDFLLNTTNLSFNSNGTQNISVTINDDADTDNETLILTVSVSIGSAILNVFEHRIVINDDEIPAIPHILITEVMQNPSAVGDDVGEYFEIYNNELYPVNLNGWTISDNNADSHTITSDLIIPTESFIVLGKNDNTSLNGGVFVNYVYSGINLANGDDELIITDANNTEVDRIEYDGGANWPNPTGAAMVYIGSTLENNNDASLWTTANISENITTDFGSPGSNGNQQIIDWLVYSNNAWNTEPTESTGAKHVLVRASEIVTIANNAIINSLELELGSHLTIHPGIGLTTNSLENNGIIVLNSTSNSYSSLISNTINTVGIINYNRSVNAYTNDGNNNDNDLITAPLSGQTFGAFANDAANANLLASGNLRAFAPFDKTTGNYTNYNIVDNANTVITAGTGYRAATSGGGTLAFSGTVETGTIAIDIQDSGTAFADWNLIGNPYPSYVDLSAFLSHEVASGVTNLDILEGASGIYGYDGNVADGWDVITLANVGSRRLAPGQGFFVAADGNAVSAYNLEFTPAMRTTGNTDDFITGRNTNEALTFLKLNISTVNKSYTTEFYFNTNATVGLDHGYDAKLWGGIAPSFALYSNLVQDNTGVPIALQALNALDLVDITIPLGVNANAGEQLTFSITDTTLPSTINVYLEDTTNNTTTLLNTSDYIINPILDISGTGRFYIRLEEQALSNNDAVFERIKIYTKETPKMIYIHGVLKEDTNAKVYDLQGRLVHSSILDSNNLINQIDASTFSKGIYVVRLSNGVQETSKKVVIQ
ncbi:endonuclease [Winogradskyella sp.]|nr:endonuclease [Winogradskyella sp.]